MKEKKKNLKKLVIDEGKKKCFENKNLEDTTHYLSAPRKSSR